MRGKNRCAHGRKGGLVGSCGERFDGCMDEQADEWMNGRIKNWRMNRLTNE
jgi:hypothetical protein